MITRKGTAFWAMIFALTLSFALAAGQRRATARNADNSSSNSSSNRPRAAGVGPVAQSKDEADAFTAVQKEQDPAKKVELAEGIRRQVSRIRTSFIMPTRSA